MIRLFLLACLATLATGAQAVTYANKSIPFSWVNTSSHAHVGYNTSPYKMNSTIAPGTGCGTAPPVLDDTISDDIPFGFNFNYGGVVFTSARIMSNGRLQFNNNTACGYGSPVTQLPYVYYNSATNNLNYSMRIYGNDLDPTPQANAGYTTACKLTTTCYMSYASIGTAPNRQFVVTWNNIPEWAAGGSTSGNYNLQIILNEDGTFIYQYGTNTAGPQATLAQVGWQVSQTDYDVPNVGLPANSSAILFYIPSPVAQYHFHQSAWTAPGDVLDTSGSVPVYNGTALGGATPGVGYVCNGADIPNNTNTNKIDAIDSGIPVSTALGGTGTIDFWYKGNRAWSGGGAQDAQLLDATTSNGEWFFLVKRSNGDLRFVITDSNGTLRAAETGTNNIPAGTWVHIAVTWNFNALAGSNQDRMRIYINGVQTVQSVFTTSGTVSSSVGTLYLGDNRSSFTGSNGTGRSADGVLDEVNIYNFEGGTGLIQRDMNYTATCNGADHIRVQHDGTAVNCLAEPVTISVHQYDHNIFSGYTGPVTLSTSTGHGDWSLVSGNGTLNNGSANDGLGTYTFVPADNGQVILGLKDTYVETVNINVTDGTISEQSGYALAAEDQDLLFAQAGFSYLADAVADNIGTQIAGKGSDIAPGNQSLALQAVKTNDQTGACEAALNAPTTIQMKLTCINPVSCVTPITVAGTPVTGAYTNLSLNFSAGIAPFVLNYADAGQVRLDAQYNIPLGDGITPSGNLMQGNSNVFVAKPAGLCVQSSDGNSDCASGDETCSAFRKAGAPFSLTVKGVAWESAGEANNQFCTGNVVTPNFQLNGIGLLQTKIAPAGAGTQNGTLGVTTVDINPADSGTHTLNNESISEVGVFTLTAMPPLYLGQTIPASSSANIGRFYPDHFTRANPAIANRSLSGCAVSPAPQPVFTYMDESLTVSYDLEARNIFNNITRNYTGAFALLPINTVSMNYGAVDTAAPTPLTSRLTTTSTIGVWTNGVAAVSSNLGINRAATEDGPYEQLTLGIDPVDTDAVAMNAYDLDVNNDTVLDHSSLGVTAVRFGRLFIGSSFGSELLPVSVPLEVQYFNGTDFVANTDDNCTTIDDVAADGAPDLILSNNVEASPQTDGNILICPAATTTMTLANNPVAMGAGNLSFSSPGAGCVGYVNISVDLGTVSPPGQNYPWLQYDWNGDGLYDDNPVGRVDFGIYKGSKVLIYTREPWD
jgi:hypothetical protein